MTTPCEIFQRNRLNRIRYYKPGIRYTPVNPYEIGFTQQQLDMRRKAEILQYNKTSNGKITKKQSWVNLVKGYTQRKQYSSYYIRQLEEGTLNPDNICPDDKFIPTSSKNSGVPGPAITLFYDPTVPLYNYNTMQFAYGTQSADTQLEREWLVNFDTDITDNNLQNIFTLNIGKFIEAPSYNYTFTTSVGLYISGYTSQTDATFRMGIPLSNLSLTVTYGGQTVPLQYTPTITYSPNFVQSISGEIVSPPATFAGKIYMGELTFSNILLSTPPNSTYDFFINYIPSYVVDKIDNVAVYIITNFKSSSQVAQLVFSAPPSTDIIETFRVSGAQQ